MKYIVVEEHRSGAWDIYNDEFDNKVDAVKKAKYIWDHLTYTERKSRMVYVIESINPDEESENHLDGGIVWDADWIYTADKETGAFIDKVDYVEEGLKLISEYEKKDKIEGTYVPDFYDIVDINHCSVR